jgi:hypothetical protein
LVNQFTAVTIGVPKVTKQTRKEREPLLNPTPTAAQVLQAGLTDDWGRTKTTLRYLDGTQQVIDVVDGRGPPEA